MFRPLATPFDIGLHAPKEQIQLRSLHGDISGGSLYHWYEATNMKYS